MRNQAEKRKKIAERVRSHRQRKKIIREMNRTSIGHLSDLISNSDIRVQSLLDHHVSQLISIQMKLFPIIL